MNLFAIGSLVKVFLGNEVLSKELFPARGYQSSVDYKLVFGLGKRQPDSVQVIWPDKTITTLLKPAINQLHVLERSGASKTWLPELPKGNALFLPIAPIAGEPHKEDDFNDFNVDRNIPVQLSREGPQLALADINADGRMDFYMAGAAGQAGQLYRQTNNGFIPSKQAVFEQFRNAEDVAVVFFDADNDQDPDLYVGSGGNRETNLPHRLYLNDGRGNFSELPGAFPPNAMNISVAAPNDIDGDGDQDLFVGARSIPGNYGISPTSYMFLNDGKGHFKDTSPAYKNDFFELGMVTDAKWADVTGDDRPELVIVGEWMSPRIFSVKNQRLDEVSTSLSTMKGWWQTVEVSDLDNDGKNDLVLGNLGRNNYLGSGGNLPVKLWINDFDGNGTIDKILSKTIEGKDMPVFMKRELTDQLPPLQKQNLKHVQYAEKTVQDLFPVDLVNTAEIKEWNEGGSFIAWNEGGGKFTHELFPYQVQLSTVNAATVTDFTGDGLPDLITAGNLTSFQPQFGSIDAGFGHVLVNQGKRVFSVLPDQQSGLMVTGVTKDIAHLQYKGTFTLMFARNNNQLLMYSKQPVQHKRVKK